MQTAYIALGSNQGDRAALIASALEAVRALPGVAVVVASPVYETPAVGLTAVGEATGQGAYLNAAAAVETALSARGLLDALLQIERDLGRVARGRRERWGARPMDLDVLLFGDAVIDEPGLKVPHPRLAQRWFVLAPLADLAPEVVHPTRGQAIAALLAEVQAKGEAASGKGWRYEPPA